MRSEPAAGAGTSLWRRPDYVRLWSSVTAANLGDGIVLAAAPLAVASFTRDPLLVSGVIIAQRLPWVLFALVAGVIVDRVDRRSLLTVANALRAAGMGGLALSLVIGLDHLALLYAAVFALGTGETLADNASLAMIPRVVPRDQLERANGRIFAAMPVANELVGPPLGAWLFAAAAAISFGAAGAAFGLAAVLAMAITTRFTITRSQPTSGWAADVWEGLRWFSRHRIVRAAAVWAGIYNLFGAAITGILVLYAQERLGLSAEQFGLFLAVAAIGGIAGGWGADRVVRRIGPGPALLISNMAVAAQYAAMAVTESAVAAATALALGSFASMLGNVVAYTLRQTTVPDELLGRVTSAYRLLALGALPLGGLVGGLAARAFGLTGPFWIAAIGMVVLGLAVAPILSTRNIRAAEVAG